MANQTGSNNPNWQTEYPHELYGTPIYTAWQNMKTRCTNEKSGEFRRYGARGISVCEKWKNFSGFLDDMGNSHQEGLSLDRINNNKGYEKRNCRWATPELQANNRRSNHLITIGEVTKTLEQWIRFYGQKSSTVRQRIFTYKWGEIKALTYKKEV